MKTRWGILGTGNIAKQFAQGLAFVPDAELVAVGSRSQKTADQFADRFNIPNRHNSYEDLAKDTQVDVIYISTPHTFHKENSLLCLRHGKAVLCEKPFTINAAEAEELIEYSRGQKLFLMEAMWNRFLPSFDKLRQLLREKVIGNILHLSADFSYQFPFDPKHRLFAPELGGGALLDLGVYPISFSSIIFGPPKSIKSFVYLGKTGVDEQAAIIFEFDGGKMATLYTSSRFTSPAEIWLLGTDGRIKIHGPIYCPSQITIYRSDDPTELNVPFAENGYNYEAAEVMRCLKTGKLESEIMPLAESLSIMQTMDRLRRDWDLKYPGE